MTNQGATDKQMLTNLINMCLGAGILSVPWGFAGASLAGGAMLTIIAAAWCTFTNIVLVVAAERLQIFTLSGLIAVLPCGKVLGPCVQAVIAFGNYLCLVAYMVIFVDCVEALSSGWGLENHRGYITAVGCVLVFPLLFLDQARLSFTSVISVAANWYILLLLLAYAMFQEDYKEVCVAGAGLGSLTLFSVLIMAISTQASVLPMYAEMQNRNVWNFSRLQISAAAVACVLFAGVAVAGNLVYGINVASNVLLELPPNPFSQLAQFGLAIVVMSMYPLVFYPVTAPIRQALQKKQKAPVEEALLGGEAAPAVSDNPTTDATFIVVCLVVNVSAGLTAATGIDLGTVNDYNGILWLVAFLILFPGYVWWFALRSNGYGGALNGFLFCCHLLVGAVTTVLCVALSKGNYVESISDHCWLWTA